jgi:hypothetical protein
MSVAYPLQNLKDTSLFNMLWVLSINYSFKSHTVIAVFSQLWERMTWFEVTLGKFCQFPFRLYISCMNCWSLRLTWWGHWEDGHFVTVCIPPWVVYDGEMNLCPRQESRREWNTGLLAILMALKISKVTTVSCSIQTCTLRENIKMYS